MKLKIKLFAGLREHVNKDSISIDINKPSVRVKDVKAFMSEKYPEMKQLLKKTRAAVDSEFVDDNALLDKGREIALIPPVAGG
ncbi:MAG: molybdopterin converting factor subunit 1 [Planctomycetes bacterium]|nr:molybdopterin converting factor subunit 1 [Planctomycetota bacterium]